MQNNTPYCYLIGWSNLNIWYYGVRYAKNCHPADLWKTYFTSSETVKQFRIEFGEPDIIEVRKQFENVDSAIKFEHKVLRRMRVVENIKWLNKTDGRAFCIEETRKTWTKKYGVDNPAKADIVKKRAKDTITKKKIENPDYINDINKKREHTCITKYGTKNPRSNITVDDKIRETNKSRYGRENLFSGKEGVDLVSAKINEKYGKPYIMQVDEFKNKMKETKLKKFAEQKQLRDEITLLKKKLKESLPRGWHMYSEERLIQIRNCFLDRIYLEVQP